ncbi:MAG: element excision factor XisH family protein, partial [Bacteroidota bacterium]
LKVDGIGFYIDVAAEKVVDRLTEEKQKIAAEVKNFIGLSEVNELEKAIGQYLLYRSVPQREDKSCELYLAIPAKFYQRIQEVRIYREALNASNIKIVIYNVAQEMIVRWIE